MVLQILANPWQFIDDWNAELLQFLASANAGIAILKSGSDLRRFPRFTSVLGMASSL